MEHRTPVSVHSDADRQKTGLPSPHSDADWRNTGHLSLYIVMLTDRRHDSLLHTVKLTGGTQDIILYIVMLTDRRHDSLLHTVMLTGGTQDIILHTQ